MVQTVSLVMAQTSHGKRQFANRLQPELHWTDQPERRR